MNESEYIVRDFEKIILGKFKLPKNLHIRDAVKISCFGNGEIDIFYEYDKPLQKHKLDIDVKFDDLLQTPVADSVGVNAEKINDVKMLMRYLSPNGKEFFETFLNET